MPYPRVLGEIETLRQVAAGASLARYGDGEFKLCRGGSIKSQMYTPALSVALREILHESGACLVGIPNILSKTPKREFWDQYHWAASLLAPRPYVSAFVSRPDSAPWLDTPEYWALLESLWMGQDVTLVRGSGKGLTCEDLTGAGTVTEILCPRQHAFMELDAILERIGTPRRALLCLGPTATVLAVELCRRGVHAIDLGHTALFLRKQRRGIPLVLTPADKA
jgi:hypothetical protein